MRFLCRQCMDPRRPRPIPKAPVERLNERFVRQLSGLDDPPFSLVSGFDSWRDSLFPKELAYLLATWMLSVGLEVSG